MSLDKELLTEEYMHGFGNSQAALRHSMEDVAAATDNFDLIPEEHQEGYRDFKSRGFYTPDVLHKKLEHISKAYRQITKIVQEQVEEREEHSHLFTLIQIFVDQLEPIIECFNQYRNKPLSEDYVENFKQYSKEITRGMSAANGLRSVMKTYNDLIDREKSAKRWMEKHPEWAEGKWKPGKKLEKKN